MYSRMGRDSRARTIFVILAVASTLYIAYDYFQRRSVIFKPMPEWVNVGVTAIYDEQDILSPGILNETITTTSWEIVGVYSKSFQVEFSDRFGTQLWTIETNDLGHINVCVFEYEGEDQVSLEEDEVEFPGFGTLRVYRSVSEFEDTVFTGLYERETGILLQLEARWKGQFSEGETMGYFNRIREMNIEFDPLSLTQ